MIVVKLQPEKPFTLREIKKLSKEIEGVEKITSEIRKGVQYIYLHIEEKKQTSFF